MDNIWSWISYKPSPYQADYKANDTQSQVKIGTVMRVNNEKMTCDVQYTYGGQDLMRDVPIGLPFATQRGFLGGMPEVGSKVVVSLIPVTDTNLTPIITAFLPPYFPVFAYNYDKMDTESAQVPGFRGTKNEVRLKNQRLYPGEIFISSDQGSDIRIDEDITLSNNKLSEIHLRGSDQSIVLNSLQYYRATDASVRIDGMVTRYVESPFNHEGVLLDKDGNPHENFGFDLESDAPKRLTVTNDFINTAASLVTPDLEQNFIMLDDGNYNWVRSLSGKLTLDDPFLVSYPDTMDQELSAQLSRELSYASLPLTESRFEIKELGDGLLNQSYPFLALDAESRLPNPTLPLSPLPPGVYLSKNLIESTQGTLVGYNFFDKPELYGKVLRHQLFDSPYTTAVHSQEIAIQDDVFPDFAKTRTWSVASMWKMPSSTSQTRFYVNKEGFVSFHIGSTRAQREHVFLAKSGNSINPVAVNPVGAGKSVEGSFGGSVRLVVEKDYKEESLELTTMGRSFLNLGCDDRLDYGYRPKTYLDNREVSVGVFEAEDLTNTRSDRISLDMTTDGGIILRVGRNSEGLARRHRHNGYDAQGRVLNRERYQTSKNLHKVDGFYPKGDAPYQYHDMQLPSIKDSYEFASLTPVISNPDRMAASLDAHLCGDAMLRIGADSIDNKSLTLDLAGALVAAIGKDSHDSRSIQALLEGGIEIDVGRISKTGNAIQGILRGDIDLRILPSNPHPNEDEGGSNNPVQHTQKTGYGLTTEGFKHRLHKGSLKSSIEGGVTTHIQGPQTTRIGGGQSTNVSGDIETFTLGGYKVNIGNAGIVLGNTTAYEVAVAAGSMRQGTLIGNLQLDTKAGNIVLDTLLGNLDFKTKAGNITVATLAGNFEGSTILGNAKISTQIGNASMTTSLGNVEVSTKLGNATFSTEIGVASLKSQILAEVVSQALVQINAKLTTVNSNLIQLGGPASIHPVPKGDQLLLWLMTHVHGTPGTPPVIPPSPAILSTVTLTS